MSPYHIVLADDHVLFRQGLKRILEEHEGFKVVGEAADGLELLSLLKSVTPHLIVLDISMPNLRGIEAVREIKANYPGVRVLILTMHKDKEYLHQAISSGSDGYLLKEDADPDLYNAIEKIRQGGTYISPHLSEGLVDDWARMRRGELEPSLESELLTTREKVVLKLIAEGKSAREVADLLFISVRTAERHRANVMEKLKMKKTADLIKYAIRKGYI